MSAPRILAKALLGVFAALPGFAEEPAPPPPEVGVHAREVAGAWQLEAVTPGPLLDALVIPPGAGQVGIWLLVADTPEGPRSLWRLDRQGTGGLVRVPGELPASAERLVALRAQPEGRVQIVIEAGAELYLVAKGGTGIDRVATRGDRAPTNRTRPAISPRPASVAAFGRIERANLLSFGLAEGALRRLASAALPLFTRRRAFGLELRVPEVTELPAEEPGSLRFAIGPEPHGNRRLRTLWHDPAAPAETREQELWALLPQPEQVAASWYGLLDGRPVLVVSTLSAEKVGIFEQQRLRLFTLGADRTKSGRPPRLAIETPSRRWLPLAPQILDFDADGRDDLALLAPEGLAGGELEIAVHLGLGGGSFRQTTRRTKLEVPLRRAVFGRDVTGDGQPDLVGIAKGELSVFPGLPPGRARGVVERRPSHRFDLAPMSGNEEVSIGVSTEGAEGQLEAPDGPSTLAIVEPAEAGKTNDRRGQILVWARSVRGRGVLRLVELR